MKNSSGEQHPEINREQDGSGNTDPRAHFDSGLRAPNARGHCSDLENEVPHTTPLELHTALPYLHILTRGRTVLQPLSHAHL